jgi:hypothetical protein
MGFFRVFGQPAKPAMRGYLSRKHQHLLCTRKNADVVTFLFQLSSSPCMRRIRLFLSVLLSFCLLVAASGAAISLPNDHAKGMRGTAAMDCHSCDGVHAQAKEAPANPALKLAVGEKTAPSCCVLVIALFEPSSLTLPRVSKTAWRPMDFPHKFSF